MVHFVSFLRAGTERFILSADEPPCNVATQMSSKMLLEAALYICTERQTFPRPPCSSNVLSHSYHGPSAEEAQLERDGFAPNVTNTSLAKGSLTGAYRHDPWNS